MTGVTLSGHSSPAPKVVLNAGCGGNTKEHMPHGFRTPEWQDIRYDINKDNAPDIVGSLTDMSAVDAASVDAVYCSHVIEHLYPHEVPIALREFYRVLKAEGFLVIGCPDLQSVAEQVFAGKFLEPAYQTDDGPVAAVDMLYGHRASMAAGNLFMAHRYGFTASSMTQHLSDAGFARMMTGRYSNYDLWGIATKHNASDDELYRLGNTFWHPFTPWNGPPAV
jgi:SAM-dependent methyltransferase